jgi:hypothetical protein
VEGKPIWDFISGEDSRHFYAAVYRNLRYRGAPITIPFRCDSPDIVRQMNLTLLPKPGGAIDCEGVLLEAKRREPITILFRWAIRSDQTIPICSLCRRLSFQGEWLESLPSRGWKRLSAQPAIASRNSPIQNPNLPARWANCPKSTRRHPA